MGTALGKLTKQGLLSGRGVGRLTEKKCDSLQNVYCGTILDIPNVDRWRQLSGLLCGTLCPLMSNQIIGSARKEQTVGASTKRPWQGENSLVATRTTLRLHTCPLKLQRR